MFYLIDVFLVLNYGILKMLKLVLTADLYFFYYPESLINILSREGLKFYIIHEKK